MQYIRLDFVFSYWIFGWFILYYYRIVSYSPKFALIIGIIENILIIFYLIFMNASNYKIIKFIIINFCIKVIPLLMIIRDKIIWKDIYATFILFIVYIIWLFINNPKKIFQTYIHMINNYSSKSDSKKKLTFLSYIYDKIYDSFH